MAKRKPKTRAELEAERLAMRAQDMAAVNLPPEVAALLSGRDIEVTRAGQKREGQKVTADSARRVDCFDALKSSFERGCFDAARRLEQDIRTRRAEGGKGLSMERVDGGSKYDQTDLIVAAGQRVDWLSRRLAPREFWLLCELIQPSREYNGWRGVVAYITGAENPVAQAERVKAAVENLRDAYDELDVAMRKAA